jgi:hypothetical protein
MNLQLEFLMHLFFPQWNSTLFELKINFAIIRKCTQFNSIILIFHHLLIFDFDNIQTLTLEI